MFHFLLRLISADLRSLFKFELSLFLEGIKTCTQLIDSLACKFLQVVYRLQVILTRCFQRIKLVSKCLSVINLRSDVGLKRCSGLVIGSLNSLEACAKQIEQVFYFVVNQIGESLFSRFILIFLEIQIGGKLF